MTGGGADEAGACVGLMLAVTPRLPESGGSCGFGAAAMAAMVMMGLGELLFQDGGNVVTDGPSGTTEANC